MGQISSQQFGVFRPNFTFVFPAHTRVPWSPHRPPLFPTSQQTSLAAVTPPSPGPVSFGHPSPFHRGRCCVQPGHGCHKDAINSLCPQLRHHTKIPAPAQLHPPTPVMVTGTSSALIQPQDKPINLPFSPCDLPSTLRLTLPLSMENSFFSPPHLLNSTHFPGN